MYTVFEGKWPQTLAKIKLDNRKTDPCDDHRWGDTLCSLRPLPWGAGEAERARRETEEMASDPEGGPPLSCDTLNDAQRRKEQVVGSAGGNPRMPFGVSCRH